MIAKLRKNFIASTMLAVVLVLVLLMGCVNIANYINTDRQADELLSYLSENEGIFPDYWYGFRGGHRGPDGPKGPDPWDYSAETPYETRYFTVRLNTYGYLLSVDTGSIAAVTTEEAVTMAYTLWQQGLDRGYLGPYKYLASRSEGVTMYVFLDCSRDLEAVRSFCLNSILVCILGAAAIFLLVLAFSKKAVAPMAESYAKQKQFITNAGHEIKTPLSIIDSCTEVLELEQGESKWTRGIREQILRLDSLTKNLVSLARLDETEQSLSKEDFDLSAAVTEALEPFCLPAEQQGLSMTLDIAPELRYFGSESALRHLCSILADNALKYTSPGGAIRFQLSRRGKKLLLSGENPAEGLEKGEQGHFFDRFWRADSSHSSETAGHGIGLSLAKAIAEAHGGSISARSDDGKTLTITVTL